MSSTSSTTTTVHRSSELDDLPLCSTMNTNPTSFAPLHRTVELENLHTQINDDNEKEMASSSTTKTTKKILTKCITVIGDGSDKQI